MKLYYKQVLTAYFLVFLVSCSPKSDTQSSSKEQNVITLREEPDAQRVDVLVDGEPFTSYRWPEGVFKPILYPIVSSGGSTITRGFPLEAREGESNDHRHQVGSWLNYGNVNEFDFWGNGHTGERSSNGGEIRHDSIVSRKDGPGEATLITKASWLDPEGTTLLQEQTEFHFFANDSTRIIDRICKLTANVPITFSDTKEGMFGLRVARSLELPSKKDVANGDAVNDEKPAGNYRSSEGASGEDVWGTRARWMALDGSIGSEEVSIIIADHPKNLSYPTWWHARPYGLFSANPLGAKDFTKGEQELNFRMAPGESTAFRYRIVIVSGKHPSTSDINAYADAFATKYLSH